jgi:hypothetical protein
MDEATLLSYEARNIEYMYDAEGKLTFDPRLKPLNAEASQSATDNDDPDDPALRTLLL